MITLTVEKKYGATTVRARISAPTVERVLERAGEGARVVLPLHGAALFAPVTRNSPEGFDSATPSARPLFGLLLEEEDLGEEEASCWRPLVTCGRPRRT